MQWNSAYFRLEKGNGYSRLAQRSDLETAGERRESPWQMRMRGLLQPSDLESLGKE